MGYKGSGVEIWKYRQEIEEYVSCWLLAFAAVYHSQREIVWM